VFGPVIVRSTLRHLRARQSAATELSVDKSILSGPLHSGS
jgi:hypothetical protein